VRAAAAINYTDHCMTDARKYRKMSVLLMLRKAKQLSRFHIRIESTPKFNHF